MNCENSFIKKRNENEKEFFRRFNSDGFFIMLSSWKSFLFMIIKELPINALISDGENIITYFLLPALLSILFLPSLKIN